MEGEKDRKRKRIGILVHLKIGGGILDYWMVMYKRERHGICDGLLPINRLLCRRRRRSRLMLVHLLLANISLFSFAKPAYLVLKVLRRLLNERWRTLLCIRADLHRTCFYFCLAIPSPIPAILFLYHFVIFHRSLHYISSRKYRCPLFIRCKFHIFRAAFLQSFLLCDSIIMILFFQLSYFAKPLSCSNFSFPYFALFYKITVPSPNSFPFFQSTPVYHCGLPHLWLVYSETYTVHCVL